MALFRDIVNRVFFEGWLSEITFKADTKHILSHQILAEMH